MEKEGVRDEVREESEGKTTVGPVLRSLVLS